MRLYEIDFIKALKPTQVSEIIPVIEAGLEFYKLKQAANPYDEQTSNRISNTCVLLSFLYYLRVGKL